MKQRWRDPEMRARLLKAAREASVASTKRSERDKAIARLRPRKPVTQ